VACLGAIVYELAVPVLLASWWALIPSGLAAFLLLLRTALEDRTLQTELAGYADYARQVRYRLLPGVWCECDIRRLGLQTYASLWLGSPLYPPVRSPPGEGQFFARGFSCVRSEKCLFHHNRQGNPGIPFEFDG
jgi:hypothetical protein